MPKDKDILQAGRDQEKSDDQATALKERIKDLESKINHEETKVRKDVVGWELIGKPHKEHKGVDKDTCIYVRYTVRRPAGTLINEKRYGPGKIVVPRCIQGYLAWQDNYRDKTEYVLVHGRDLGVKSTGKVSAITLS